MVDGTRIILAIILTVSLVSLPPNLPLGVLPQASAVTGSLSVNPTSGFPGNSVAVTGTAFAGSGIVWFDTNNNAIFDAGEPFTSVSGSSFTVTVTVPVTPAGNYRIRADAPQDGVLDANANFLVKSPPLISITDVSLLEGNGGATNFVFSVSLNELPSTPVTVDFTTSDGTATIADNDYNSNSGTLTLSSGNPSGTIVVAVVGDTLFEPDETFSVNLSNPTNALISDGQGVGVIQNDDAVPNQPPSVNAGPDQTITLPNTVLLSGIITDDGLPAGATMAISWSKASGPSSVIFSSPNSASTTASFGESGTYVLRLTANDSEQTSSDDIVILVSPVPPPRISVDTTAILFGSLQIGTTSSARTVTVTNTGTDALTVSSVALGGINQDDFAITDGSCANAPLILSPSNACSLSVVFSPTISGPAAATITISSNDPDAPTTTVSLSGNGEIPVVTDNDGDGVPDSTDQCQDVPGLPPDGCPVSLEDGDSDGVPDSFDQCPDDPNKAFPGTQGCGNSDTVPLEQQISNQNQQIDFLNQQISGLQTDSDGDGFPDIFDQCDSDPLKILAGASGCGNPEPDLNQLISDLQNTISSLNSQVLQMQQALDGSNPVYCGIPQNSWPVVIRGTAGDDKLVGTNNNDLILGFGGNDKIIGKQGNDCIIGGPGNDILFGNLGNDNISGNDGNDRIHGGVGSDNIDGGSGTDRCTGGQGANTIASCELPDPNMKEEDD